jgi:regulatory protein
VPAARAAEPSAVGADAVALLARRDYSCAGLRQRLVARGFEPATVQQVIEELLERHYLDDERYAAQYVSYQGARGQGPRRIGRDLAAEGLGEELITAALATIEDWAALARELRIRRFGLAVPANWQEKARQARFLLYRGFTTDHIRSALGPDFPAIED